MADIKIEVWDATGNKRQLVEVPADAEVNRLIAVLIDRMNLPRNSPDGQLMSYKFHHKSSGRQLLDTETLVAANVRDGDILRLQPEITAGNNVTAIADETKMCPLCGEQILAIAKKCRHCGRYLDKFPRPIEAAPGAFERVLMPVGRPISAIAAGYLALFAIIPLFGLPMSIGALWCGIVGIKTINSNPTLSGRGRAWFGIVVGGTMTAINLIGGGLFIAALVVEWSRQ
jgi:hypothetical protein